jgi:hypothetical protein
MGATRIEASVSDDDRQSMLGWLRAFNLERNGEFMYVDTIPFQAPAFYVSLGFQEVGRLVSWDSNGHDKIFFYKRLSVSDSPGQSN